MRALLFPKMALCGKKISLYKLQLRRITIRDRFLCSSGVVLVFLKLGHQDFIYPLSIHIDHFEAAACYRN